MENIKNAFRALPHVNEVWRTKDGHFHLHPNNGGEKINREDVDLEEEKLPKPAKEITEARPKTTKEIIDLINCATTEEEVISFAGNDTRKTVKDAAEKKIASFQAGTKE